MSWERGGTGAKHGLRLSPLAAQILRSREQGPLWQLVFDLLSQPELDEAGWKKWLESAEFQWAEPPPERAGPSYVVLPLSARSRHFGAEIRRVEAAGRG